jgi:hypothetical protein
LELLPRRLKSLLRPPPASVAASTTRKSNNKEKGRFIIGIGIVSIVIVIDSTIGFIVDLFLALERNIEKHVTEPPMQQQQY